MNPRDLLLLSLRRQDLDYQVRAREALAQAEESLKTNEIQFAKLLIAEFIFNERAKSGQRLNSTQEIALVLVIIEMFTKDDPSKLTLFYNLFEPGKSSRKYALLKLIITAIAADSPAVSYLI